MRVFISLFFLSTFLTGNIFAQGQPIDLLGDLFKETSKQADMTGLNSPKDCPDPGQPQNLLPAYTTNAPSGSCNLQTANICKAASNYCSGKFGSAACVESDKNKKQQLLNNANYKARITRVAQNIFARLKSDSTLTSQCCGTDLKCKVSFSQTGFDVLEPMDGETQTEFAHYQHEHIFKDKIEISISKLITAQTPEVIEYMILHELGHACQYALAVTPKRMSELDATESKAPIRNPVGYERLNPEVSNCITEAIQRERANPQSASANFRQWQEEIFADAIFASRNKTPKHLSYSCGNFNSRASQNHAPSKVYLDCLTKDPGVQRNFCP